MLGAVFAAGSMAREAGEVARGPLTTAPGCYDAPVVQVDQSGISGQAALCITDEAVRPALRVANLTPDTAYLALFQYFGEPSACQTFPCGVTDLRADGAVGVMARMDAIVANGTGRADFWGDFRDLPISRKTQVTLTLFDRGKASIVDGRRRAYQLLTLPLIPADASVPEDSTRPPLGRRVAQAHFLPESEMAP